MFTIHHHHHDLLIWSGALLKWSASILSNYIRSKELLQPLTEHHLPGSQIPLSQAESQHPPSLYYSSGVRLPQPMDLCLKSKCIQRDAFLEHPLWQEGRKTSNIRGGKQPLLSYLHIGWVPLETLLGSKKSLVPFPKAVKCIGFIAQQHSQFPRGSPVSKNKPEISKAIILQIQGIVFKDHHSGAGYCQQAESLVGNTC